MSEIQETVRYTHELVRAFVEKETGGYVEKIDARSRSAYGPTLDSLEDVKATSPQDVFKERFFTRHTLKATPTFIPTFYDASYDVTVVFPPGGEGLEVVVALHNGKLEIVKRMGVLRGWS